MSTDALEAAHQAAESIRDLNHATIFTPAAYTWPSDVGSVLGALQLVAQRLPQALEQAGRWLDGQADAGRVGHDEDGDVDMAVASVLVALQDAQRAAGALAGAVSEAQYAASHLTGKEG